jgi:hypothetical protein
MQLSRREWLLSAALSSACAAADPQRPRLEPRLNLLWDRALGPQFRSYSQAVLVSRVWFQRLPKIRSWRDEPALLEYLGWADRLEAVAFEGGSLEADFGPYDWVLLRVPAEAIEADVPIHADPVGFAAIEPPREGRVRIPVQVGPAPALSRILQQLPTQAPPVITAAVRSAEGTVTVYGRNLGGTNVEAFSRSGRGTALYVSNGQVNVRPPSIDAIRLIVDGIETDWETVQ